jgi:heterodisulfide reductase subunit C
MHILINDRTVDAGFVQKLAEISGQNVYQCMQCGTCTACCPMQDGMQIAPRRVMHLAQMGLSELVQDANTPWLCASCHACQARCPRCVDLPKVMEAVRLLTLRRNKDRVDLSRLEPTLIGELPQIAMVSCFRKMTA